MYNKRISYMHTRMLEIRKSFLPHVGRLNFVQMLLTQPNSATVCKFSRDKLNYIILCGAESAKKFSQTVKLSLLIHVSIFLLHRHHHYHVHAATDPYLQRSGVFKPLTVSSPGGGIIWVTRLYDVTPMASQAQCIIQCLCELTCAYVTYSMTSSACTLYAKGSSSYNVSVGDLVTFTIASKSMVVSILLHS